MREHQDAAPEVVDRLRAICLGLPEAYEERAWVGTRWVVRKRTFAHIATVVDGWPPAFARVAESDGPLTILVFRSEGDELGMIQNSGPPFLNAGWGRDAVGMVVDDATDWDEVTELLTESYCVMAPQKLVDQVDRPPAD